DDGFREAHAVTSTRSGKWRPTPGETQVAEKASQSVADATRETASGTELYEICLARSGDKGDTANIGIMARSRKAFEFLDDYLTAQRVKDLFQELCLGKVVRHKVENMLGFNFLLENSLGGGGTMTLRADAQG